MDIFKFENDEYRALTLIGLGICITLSILAVAYNWSSRAPFDNGYQQTLESTTRSIIWVKAEKQGKQ